MRNSGPPSLICVLRDRDPLLARVVDAASAEASLILGQPFAGRLTLMASVRSRRALTHGSTLAPLGDFDWSAAFLYRRTHDAGRLERLVARRFPYALAPVTAVVTDVELEPPPEWRYVIFRTFKNRGSMVSLAPLDPRFWGEARRDRVRLLKTRLRAALVAALAPGLRLGTCEEPGCYFDRTVDGVDALDAMERVGTEHTSHPRAGQRFRPAARALDLDHLETPPPPARPRHPRAFERRPSRPLPVAVRWQAGPTAALEIFHVERAPSGRISFERRHQTPWAPTVRPPVETVTVDLEALARVRESMERALKRASFRGVNVPAPGPGAADAGTVSPLDELRQAGGRLYDIVFPLPLERGLTRKGVFLELGIDETLLDEPFELMHDHQGFLALRHFVGRFVNTSSSRPSAHKGPLDRPEVRSRRLRALVVAVAAARSAPASPLPEAEQEARAASRALAGLGAHTTELVGAAATVDAVYEALRTGPHLLHYSGHAELGGEGVKSRLLLADGDLDGESLARAAARRPPVVALLNACEAGRVPSFADAGRVQGLVDALLLAGSYVVAARWPVSDGAARAFAQAFYAELLERRSALGVAVTRGREAARRESAEDDLTWAAYVLYGDPKIALGGA